MQIADLNAMTQTLKGEGSMVCLICRFYLQIYRCESITRNNHRNWENKMDHGEGKEVQRGGAEAPDL